MSEQVRHNCGFSVAHTLHDAHRFIRSLQHRGREAAGIAAVGDNRIDVIKWAGGVERFPPHRHLLFVAFFPYVVAGPVAGAQDLEESEDVLAERYASPKHQLDGDASRDARLLPVGRREERQERSEPLAACVKRLLADGRHEAAVHRDHLVQPLLQLVHVGMEPGQPPDRGEQIGRAHV